MPRAEKRIRRRKPCAGWPPSTARPRPAAGRARRQGHERGQGREEVATLGLPVDPHQVDHEPCPKSTSPAVVAASPKPPSVLYGWRLTVASEFVEEVEIPMYQLAQSSFGTRCERLLQLPFSPFKIGVKLTPSALSSPNWQSAVLRGRTAELPETEQRVPPKLAQRSIPFPLRVFL
jgi:hypothetical protein